ncbi:MAG: hypothetical protein KBT20_05695 [Bacteroidales bacterium]|nr:hypothetical protein [Candidatus Liminaster caballi]
MATEQIDPEWLLNQEGLPDSKAEIAEKLYSEEDFLVVGDAMSFIEEIAPAFNLNVVCVKLQTLDDLRGTPIVKNDEQSGLNYFEYEVEWMKAVENSEKKSLVIFNIDQADDRLINGLKSFVERHGEDYFVALICTDTTRDLKHTTTYSLVRPAIHYDC